jgi:hypothetical protein
LSEEELQHGIDACTRLMPEAQSEQWNEGQAAADDAAAAVCYALRARQTGSPQEAAWAARRVYEALDEFVINRGQIDTNRPGMENRVLADPLVQSELERQKKDLDDLLSGTHAQIASIQRVRQRARSEAKVFFGFAL